MWGNGLAVALALAEFIENLLQIIAAGDDDSEVDCPQLEKKAEVVEVAVEEWVLVGPFHFQRDFGFEAVDLVGWRVVDVVIDGYPGGKSLLHPAASVEGAV
jgi:hypothetical protein